MRSIVRKSLSSSTEAILRKRTAAVGRAADMVEQAKRSWRNRTGAAFEEIRKALREMAHGRERCMYCEDSAGTDIDHFRPIAKYPGHAFDWLNYLLACSHCNSNEKRDLFPLDSSQSPMLLDPSDPTYDLMAHFVFVPETGQLVEQTARATETRKVFGLDRQILERGRRHAWTNLLVLVRGYDGAVLEGDTQRAAAIVDVLRGVSFSCVFEFLVRMAAHAQQRKAVPADVRTILEKRPELAAMVVPRVV